MCGISLLFSSYSVRSGLSRFDQDLMITLTLLNVLACAFGAIRLIWLANSLLLSCENGEERLIQLTMCNKKQQGTFWIT